MSGRAVSTVDSLARSPEADDVRFNAVRAHVRKMLRKIPGKRRCGGPDLAWGTALTKRLAS